MSKLSIAVASLALAIASLGAPSASQAQITPAPNTFTFSGPAVFITAGGPPISCTANFVMVVHAGGMIGAVTSFSLVGSPICGTLVGTALPWSVARIPPGSLPRFAISNIRITGLLGYCDKGTIHVSWVNAPHNMGYAETQGIMPGNFNGLPYPNGSCELDVELNLTSTGPFNVQ